MKVYRFNDPPFTEYPGYKTITFEELGHTYVDLYVADADEASLLSELAVSPDSIQVAPTPNTVAGLITAINAETQRRIYLGVVYGGLTFRASRTDQQKISDLAINAILAQVGIPVLNFPIEIPSDTIVDGVQQLLIINNAIEALAFVAAMKLNPLTLTETARTLRDQVRLAATIEDAIAIAQDYIDGN